MKLNKLMLCLLFVLATLSGCSDYRDYYDPSTNPTNLTARMEYGTWIDPKTGVNYIYFDGYKRFGITVRLDADGKPIVTR